VPGLGRLRLGGGWRYGVARWGCGRAGAGVTGGAGP